LEHRPDRRLLAAKRPSAERRDATYSVEKLDVEMIFSHLQFLKLRF
jgi:hypothetical protein